MYSNPFQKYESHSTRSSSTPSPFMSVNSTVTTHATKSAGQHRGVRARRRQSCRSTQSARKKTMVHHLTPSMVHVSSSTAKLSQPTAFTPSHSYVPDSVYSKSFQKYESHSDTVVDDPVASSNVNSTVTTSSQTQIVGHHCGVRARYLKQQTVPLKWLARRQRLFNHFRRWQNRQVKHSQLSAHRIHAEPLVRARFRVFLAVPEIRVALRHHRRRHRPFKERELHRHNLVATKLATTPLCRCPAWPRSCRSTQSARMKTMAHQPTHGRIVRFSTAGCCRSPPNSRRATRTCQTRCIPDRSR